MQVKKRDGLIEEFDATKIANAVCKAFNSVDGFITVDAIEVSKTIANDIFNEKKDMSVEEIQNIVEHKLMETKRKDVAKAYILYRDQRTKARGNIIDVDIAKLIEDDNDYWKAENANKNPQLHSTKRDYIAGIVSKDATERILMPKDIMQAHAKGILHFHDADYFISKMHNCDLVNLDDMLQNGTVISEVMIEKPHSFSTACTVTTQIIAQVASSQYGGQSISLEHLAPFVDVSRQRIRQEVIEELKNINHKPDDINRIVEQRLKKEVKKGIQTIQYQLVTLMTTNGQAPFITIYMYLNEARDEQTETDLAMLIEEVLKQRIQGVKNEKGVYIAPAFPKLIYVLQDNNIHKGDKYWYLTELCAKCNTKRLVPDYISEKVMKQLKGDVYTCMGCVDKNEVIDYKIANNRYVESFERAWARLQRLFPVELQPNKKDYIINPRNVTIWDNKKQDYVAVKHIIKNHNDEWLRLTFSNGRLLDCTKDHPFDTSNGQKCADELTSMDNILIDRAIGNASGNDMWSKDAAWLLGVTICDGNYKDHVTVSLGLDETDIAEKYQKVLKYTFNLDSDVKERHRGIKGNYIDIVARSYESTTIASVSSTLLSLFGAYRKVKRQIPSDIFNSDKDVKLAFLAGMIDADGYINSTKKLTKVQIGSTNKSLAIQQMLLAQSVGMSAQVYRNHYNSNNKNAIRYLVEFVPSDDLLMYIVSEKKKSHVETIQRTNKATNETNYCMLTDKKEYKTENQFSYDVETDSEHFTVSGIYSHNCRSFLTPDRFTDKGIGNISNSKNYKQGKHKYYGRFNQGVVTVNLPDIAFSSKGDTTEFWKIFDERMELCHRALRERHERLKGTVADVAPILWRYGALARLDHGEKIDKLLYDGYSTISLGYAGLYECVKYMTGSTHSDGGVGEKFGLAVMQAMYDYCQKWKEEENIDYSPYGTPLESTTLKFATCLKKRFGDDIFIKLDGSDRNYITNSYHVPVFEKINAFDKLAKESKFQELSAGGNICYIEIPDLHNNIEAVLQVIQFMYENTMYAEVNTKSCYCSKCGYDGDILIVDKDGVLKWVCPNCGNDDASSMDIAFRVCGYLGTAKNGANQGRMGDIHDRVKHLDDMEYIPEENEEYI